MNISLLSEDDYYKRLDSPHNPPSKETPEDAFDSEYFQLFNQVGKIMEKFGNSDAYGQADYILEPHIAESRGLGITISNPSVITETLLLNLQETISAQAPNWEIFLGSSEYDFGLFITPERIYLYRMNERILLQLDEFVTSDI